MARASASCPNGTDGECEPPKLGPQAASQSCVPKLVSEAGLRSTMLEQNIRRTSDDRVVMEAPWTYPQQDTIPFAACKPGIPPTLSNSSQQRTCRLAYLGNRRLCVDVRWLKPASGCGLPPQPSAMQSSGVGSSETATARRQLTGLFRMTSSRSGCCAV